MPARFMCRINIHDFYFICHLINFVRFINVGGKCVLRPRYSTDNLEIRSDAVATVSYIIRVR